MKKIILTILVFLAYASQLNAQGFDWQYSARLPFKTPKLFLGISSGSDYNFHQGEFNFIENYVQCCTFKNGKGVGYFAGLQGEYWYHPQSAVYVSLIYSYIPAKFIIESEPLPIAESEDFRSEYELDEIISNFAMEIGTKLRLFDTHFHISAGARLSLLIGNKGNYYERVLSHKDWYWDERKIIGAELPDVKTLNFTPIFRFGYDASIGLGKYMVPEIIIGIPVSNIISSQIWKRYFVSFAITVYPLGIK